MFSTSSNENGSGRARAAGLNCVRRADESAGWLFSLSVLDACELREDVLEWRLVWFVGRQLLKLGLFACGAAESEVDDDEY